jgi:hypothetical protein
MKPSDERTASGWRLTLRRFERWSLGHDRDCRFRPPRERLGLGGGDAGNDRTGLEFPRQLGHRSITTTEQHYGHLELNLFTTALQATDDAISRAGQDQHAGLIGAAGASACPGC